MQQQPSYFNFSSVSLSQPTTTATAGNLDHLLYLRREKKRKESQGSKIEQRKTVKLVSCEEQQEREAKK